MTFRPGRDRMPRLEDDGRPLEGSRLNVARTLQEPLFGRRLVGLPHNRSKPSRGLFCPPATVARGLQPAVTPN